MYRRYTPINSDADAIGAFVIMLIFSCALCTWVFGKLDSYDQRTTVAALSWRRIVPVQEYKTLEGDESKGWVPPDAYERREYTDCDTSINLDGDISIDCETRVSFKVDRWTWVYDLETHGPHTVDRYWPDFIPSQDQGKIGALRALPRREVLQVTLARKAGDSALFTCKDEAEWESFLIGQSYALRFNRWNEPLFDTLRLEDMR